MPDQAYSPFDFAQLSRSETVRRNLRKTPEERVETLLAALRDTAERGWWPVIDRRAKEQRLLCLIREKSSLPLTSTKSSIS